MEQLSYQPVKLMSTNLGNGNMRQFIGSLLFFIGLTTLIYSGINYINNTESFALLGMDLLVSKGNITPVIISGVIMLVGLGIKPKS